ncbi:type II secretion system F family protein [Rhodococcus sp. SGAir0479]|uniref:type II secretion system F family protein n=1 Tax=Rhodococcus sp. SGAir0479 TaxID=2567884 RepID=UPI0010CCFDC1|nr:type ii secretion system integral membrane subunit [Rhodococcus sp. SGAir0479]QCQ93492.1 type ii secretion system integral membrane subunit [Rhodococcus sp. SGAir0479]
MTAALLCLAGAILVLPTRAARIRLRGVQGRPVAPRGAVARVRRAASRRGLSPVDLAFLVCVPLAALGAVTPAVAAAVLAATVRRRHRRRRAADHRARQRRGVLAGLDVVIGELRVGAHPAVACETAAAECDGVAADAFRCAGARARLGGSAAGGLLVPSSVVADDLQRIANAWAVAESHGLALADLLQAARSDLLGRNRFRTRTDASLAGARATAAVLAGLPVLGIGLGQLMGAAPVTVLLGGGLGGVLLIAGTVLVAAGLAWTDRIVDRVMA